MTMGYSMHDALDSDGGGFAAADTEHRDGAFQIVHFERRQQRGDYPCRLFCRSEADVPCSEIFHAS